MNDVQKDCKPVDKVLGTLFERIEEANNQLDVLITGMVNILRSPDPPPENVETTKDCNPRCSLANQLSDAAEHVFGLTRKIREVRDRLEA
jgi:hypothetical protein